MKVKWFKDEWWPVYTLEDGPGSFSSDEAEVTPELFARYQKALTEWVSVQDDLGHLLDPPGPKGVSA